MKDYCKWHVLKTQIENSDSKVQKIFKEGEVWWCAIVLNIGFEEDGKNNNYERPVLIFRKFNKEMFWGLPMTSKQRGGKFYYSFKFRTSASTVILSQLRTFSSKRLIRHMGKVDGNIFGEIEKGVLELIKETDPFRGPRLPFGDLR